MKYGLPLILVFCAACGVDGDPVAPRTTQAAETGLTISGQADIGIAIR